MLDQDRLSSPSEVTKEVNKDHLNHCGKQLGDYMPEVSMSKNVSMLISRKSGKAKFPLLLYDLAAS